MTLCVLLLGVVCLVTYMGFWTARCFLMMQLVPGERVTAYVSGMSKRVDEAVHAENSGLGAIA
jgi:hypothetical protein